MKGFLRRSTGWLLGLAAVALAANGFAQAPDPNLAAALLLDTARRAYNGQRYAPAADQFREFLKKYGGHAEVAWAHYGLGLSLLQIEPKDLEAAHQSLQHAAGRGDFPAGAQAMYYAGVARRGLGERLLDQAAADPQRAGQLRQTAMQRFSEAAASFAAAGDGVVARLGTPLPATERPEEFGWIGRCRCDQADMLLRSGRFQEAADLLEAFLRDPAISSGTFQEPALYHLGCARFALRDPVSAGRALSRLAPFRQEFGAHARYLLGRVHHQSSEAPEAAAQYQAVVADYAQRKAQAQEALKNPAALTAERRAALERLSRDDPPDFVVQAAFYLAMVACEQERFVEAAAAFGQFVTQYPKSEWREEAQLRQGFCLTQLRRFQDAVKLLEPLVQHATLGDRALWWLARGRLGMADPQNAQTFAQAVPGIMDAFRQAAEKAANLARQDSDARVRRGDILLEWADAMMRAGQFREAAETLQRVLQENVNPDRAEWATQRRVVALHLAGMLAESDQAAAAFERTFPISVLLPSVLFRVAENAYQRALAALAKPDLPNRPQGLAHLFGEAVARYRQVIGRFPDFEYANHARVAIGACYALLERYDDAVVALRTVPSDAWLGDLAGVPYLLSDCLLRVAQPAPVDAVAAGESMARYREAASLLERFTSAQGTHPDAPAGLLKLGLCYGQIAGLAAEAAEKTKAWTSGRAAYERLLQQFPQHPLCAPAVYERALCIEALGDAGGAINELGRFQGDPLRQSDIAPLASLRFAQLMRQQNRAPDAARVLEQCRAQHEKNLLSDASRRPWAPLLRYEHALAVLAMGKPADARGILESIEREFPDHEAGWHALWRMARCRRDELGAALDQFRAAAARNARPEDQAATARTVEQGVAALRDATEYLQARADVYASVWGRDDTFAWMLYEVAQSYRALAGVESDDARRRVRDVLARAVLKAPAVPAAAGGQPAKPPLEAEASLSSLSPRMAERAAADCYERLIAGAPDAPVSVRARVELAELHLGRGRLDVAERLLIDVLAKSPPADLAGRVRLSLASLCLSRGDPTSARRHAAQVGDDPNAPLTAAARCLMGEASFAEKQWESAVERLLPFRDQAAFQNRPGVTDRALLRLGQTYIGWGRADEGRRTLELLTQRFAGSEWQDEALYSIGASWQNQGEHEKAIAAFEQVCARTLSEWAARARIQVGTSRAQQGRHREAVESFLSVPALYAYTAWHGPAYCEAAKAWLQLKQPVEAANLCRQVIRDEPGSPWAEQARLILAEIN